MFTRLLILPVFLMVLGLSGCGTPAHMANGTKNIYEQPLTVMPVGTTNSAVVEFSKWGVLKINPGVVQCNYFLDESKNCMRSLKYHLDKQKPIGLRPGTKTHRPEGIREDSKTFEFGKYLNNNLLTSKETKFVMTITGIKNGNTVSISLKPIIKEARSYNVYTRKYRKQKITVVDSLDTSELKRQLKYDPDGYYISGYVSFKLPQKYLNTGNDSYNRLVLPFAWDKYYQANPNLRNDVNGKFYTHLSSGKYALFKKSDNQQRLKDNKTFILAKGVPEYMGWLPEDANSPLQLWRKAKIEESAKVWIAGKEKREQKRLARNRLAEKERIIKKGIRKSKLTKEFNAYVAASEACTFLRDGRSNVQDFICSNYSDDKSTTNRCKRQKQRLLGQFDLDMAEACSAENMYKTQFLDIFGSSNKEAIVSVLNDSKDENENSWSILEKEYPYANIDFKDWRTSVQKGSDDAWNLEIRNDLQKSNSAMRKSWQKKLSGQPSAVDKMYGQQQKMLRDVLSNNKKLRQEAKQPSSYKYKKPTKDSRKSSAYRGKNTPNAEQFGVSQCSEEDHTVPRLKYEGKMPNFFGRADSYMKDKCGSNAVRAHGAVTWDCIVLKKSKYKGNDTKSCTSNPLTFSCGCEIKAKRAGSGASR